MPDIILPGYVLTHAAMFALGAAAVVGLAFLASRKKG